MILKINDKKYPVTIVYKANKNMYLRVKDDLSILVTAPFGISATKISKFINSNLKYITKAILAKEEKLQRYEDKFLFLGKLYDKCYINKRGIELGCNKAFIGNSTNVDNWYLKQAKIIFTKVYDECFNNFNYEGKKPLLRIRKMKSKWGVCNVTNNIITLNLELIKFDLKYLEYVIYHELCHLIYPNHSEKFWSLVSNYVPNYKSFRKEMKNI